MRAYSNSPSAIKQRKWRDENPERARLYYKKCNEKRRDNGTVKQYRERPLTRYKMAKGQAKYEGRDFTLSFEEYSGLLNRPCYYCGAVISGQGRGLDRIDNSKGYYLSNVLPCCATCNQARNTFFTVEEFKIMMDALLKFRKRAA